MVAVYSPTEGEGAERGKFWNDLDKVVDRVGNGYKLCVLADLNGLFGDKMRADITAVFGVMGENDNGRRD